MGIFQRISRIVQSQFANRTRQFEDILQDSDEELRRLIDELSRRGPNDASAKKEPESGNAKSTTSSGSKSSFDTDSGETSSSRSNTKSSDTHSSQQSRSGSSQQRQEQARPGNARHQAQVQAVYQAYKLLGIPPTAGIERIKSAYREKIRAVHPDTVANQSQAQQDSAKRKAQEINMAYEVLARVRGFK